jgi:molybdopterin molybdotransferase
LQFHLFFSTLIDLEAYMISLDEAKAKTLENVTPLGVETCSVGQAVGRVLAQNLMAQRTQPPYDLSAMDVPCVQRAR